MSVQSERASANINMIIVNILKDLLDNNGIVFCISIRKSLLLITVLITAEINNVLKMYYLQYYDFQRLILPENDEI